MNKIFIIVLFFVYGCLDNTSDLTMQTLTHDNVVREYYVSYPENIDGPVPLIINMHGFASHAIEQKDYSQMDSYAHSRGCLLYTSPSPRDGLLSRMPSSA